MFLQITLNTIGQFLSMYWFLIVFLGGMIWKLILMNFKQRDLTRDIKEIKTGEIVQVKASLISLQAALKHHDDVDKEVERNLTTLIDRNHQSALNAAISVKDKLDTAATLEHNKLDAINNGLVEVQTTMKLIVAGKIKIDMQ